MRVVYHDLRARRHCREFGSVGEMLDWLSRRWLWFKVLGEVDELVEEVGDL